MLPYLPGVRSLETRGKMRIKDEKAFIRGRGDFSSEQARVPRGKKRGTFLGMRPGRERTARFKNSIVTKDLTGNAAIVKI